MKKFLAILYFLILSNPICASEAPNKQITQIAVKLPNEQTIVERLEKIGLEHFMEKTKIHKKLAEKEMVPTGIAMLVGNALIDYVKDLKQPRVSKIMLMHRDLIIECLLQDHPEAIKFLLSHGMIDSKHNIRSSL